MKKLFLLIGISPLALAACDSGTPYMNMGACGGHGQPACANDGYKMLEGGEIRIESRDKQDGSHIIVAQGWFLSAQTPAKLMGATVGSCVDVASFESTFYPTSTTTKSRTYIDEGPSMTLSNGSNSTELDRMMDTPDFRGLKQQIIYVANGKATGGADPMKVPANTKYDVTLMGMKQTFQLYVPGNWTATGGPMQFDTGMVQTIPKGQDLVWQYNGPDDDATYTNLQFLGFKGTINGKNSFMFCAYNRTDTGAGTGAGKITIPAATIDQIPPTGLAYAATMSHQKINFNGRNLDVIGISCKLADYQVK